MPARPAGQFVVVFELRAMELQNFFGLDGLADLGARSGIDMRPTLLRVLTDLYVHRLSHTPAEERHYTELALRLLDAVDVPTRIAVAKRFARYHAPPLRVLQSLTRDVPDVAVELRAHPLLQPAATARSAPAMPAQPPSAAEPAMPATAARPGAASSAIEMATAIELNELFFDATVEERRLILLNLDIVAPISGTRPRVTGDPSIAQRLEAAALTGRREEFANHLARALHISREQARRVTRDEFGEPILVAAKALGMTRDVLYRILMFINPAIGHSVERMHALASLYGRMSAPAAAGVLVIWQALQPAESVRYRPVAWDDDTSSRARPAAATAQREPAVPRTGARRNAS
jgi:hypothetical protein